jgi:hypothetical protein
MGVPEIRAEDLKKRLDAGENLFLLDVRDEFEFETSNIGGYLIPLAELPRRVKELDPDRTSLQFAKWARVALRLCNCSIKLGSTTSGTSPAAFTPGRTVSITEFGSTSSPGLAHRFNSEF